MGISVLCELESIVCTGCERSKAFHPKRQEALRIQVSEWWHQPRTPYSGVSQTLILSPSTTFFSEILRPELSQVSSHSSFEGA